MRRDLSTCLVLGALCGLCTPVLARAQTSTPLEAEPDDAPSARTGFQFATRTGYMIPFGRAAGTPGSAMGDTFSGQVPLILDVGWKVRPHFFFGGYLGLGVGGAAGASGRICNQDNLGCVAASVRLGIEAQYQFAPASATNPWIGYGIGIESTGVRGGRSGDQDADDPPSYSVDATGWELAHLMAGLDFRLSKWIGLGPIADFSLAEYTTLTTTQNGATAGGAVTSHALHEWLLVGVRVVLLP